VLDGAVTIFDGKMGVEAQSETVWRQANKYGVPRLCFINKINQTGGDFYKSLESIHNRLSKNALPVHLPIGFEKDINGVVDLVEMKAYTYSDYTDKQLVEGEIPADMVEKATNARALLVEAAVEAEDELMEKFFEGGADAISTDELKRGLRKRVLAGDFYLVSFASPVDYIPGNARLYLRPGEGASDATSSGAVPERLYLLYDTRYEISFEFHYDGSAYPDER
jgi:elongation factor G